MKNLISSLIYTAVTVSVATLGQYVISRDVNPIGIVVMAVTVFLVNMLFQRYYFRKKSK